MSTIPVPGSELRHVRKTITFTGGAGAGLLGDTVPCFALTGRVLVAYWTIICSDSLACTAPLATALGMGTASWSESLTTAMALSGGGNDAAVGTWLTRSDGWYAVGVGQPLGNAANPGAFTPLSQSIVLAVNDLTGGANITGGSVIVDVWYYPITDDGALAGDDIDEPLRDHIWAKALSDLAAVPAATASALAGLNWLFTLGRNRRKQTATTETVYKDDATTAAATSTKSDDGTTFERSEYS